MVRFTVLELGRPLRSDAVFELAERRGLAPRAVAIHPHAMRALVWHEAAAAGDMEGLRAELAKPPGER